ncbi:PAS domain S-box protein [Candidatus Bathyarchaeota archaeon]|nr:PAS domain S-box protein [Candidatus Bathyarchaeota archaeon]
MAADKARWDNPFRSLYENSFDAVLLTKPNGTLLAANPAACGMFGESEDELLNSKRADLVVVDEKCVSLLNERKKMGKARGELTLKRKDGSSFEGEVTSTIFLDADGLEKTIMIIRDITQQKKTEETLKESEGRYRSLFEQAGDYILVFELPKVGIPIICDANTAALNVHGYSREELIGKPISIINKQIELKTKKMREITSTGNVDVFEVIHQRKDGSFFEAEVALQAVKIGNKTHILSVERDITERKRTQEKLQQIDLIFKNSLDMICMAGFDGYFKVLNPAWSKILGWSNKELLSKPWIEFVHPDDQAATANARATLIDGQKVFQFENRYICKDGSVRWLSWNSFPYPKKNIIFGMARDITGQKEADEEVAAANEKIRVVGSLTRHDVKNKLSIILSNTYLLRRIIGDKIIGDSPTLVKLFTSIENAVEASNKLFEFSSYYEKIGVEQPSEINVGDFFKQAVALQTNLPELQIFNECNGFKVIADSLLRQIFYNLIDNSVKHGQKTSKIHLYYLKEQDAIKLIYQDDGVGIPEANKPRMFSEGFTTGNGSGLGLMLVKKIVEAYGWDITEEGAPGLGVKFVISMPDYHLHSNLGK